MAKTNRGRMVIVVKVRVILICEALIYTGEQ